MAILELLPQAELFTTVYDPAPWPDVITGRKVHSSILDRIPGARQQYPKLLPLMNTAWRRFDLTGFDLIVSSNHASAKNIRVPPGVPHVCYCHTPMRYVHDPELMADERLGRVQRLAFGALRARLLRDDLRGARGVDRFAANSTFVAERIARYYERTATVIHPPVDVERFLGNPRSAGPDAPFLVFGRLVPYKKVDVAIETCAALGLPLRIVGDGRDLSHLRALAASAPQIEFLGPVQDCDLPELFSTSRALLFPGLEDFGIVPVEAQAAGLPVIAYGSGGVRDSVIDGVTGVLYADPSAPGLAGAIRRFESISLQDADLRSQASRFAPEHFKRRFAALLEDA